MDSSRYRSTRWACYRGYVVEAIINNLAPLLFIIFQTNYGVDFEGLGWLLCITFLTQLGVDALAAKYVDRFGYRRVIVLAHFLSAAGLVCLGILPRLLSSLPYLGIVIAVVLYSSGSGLIEVMVSPMIEALPSEKKSASMSFLHSFYCWGQMAVVLITTLLLSWIGNDLWFILPLLWALFPVYNLIRFLKVPIRELNEEEEPLQIRKMFSIPVFRMGIVLMFCGGACELAMSQWASLFAETGLGVSKVTGDLLGPCLFAMFMGLGRVSYSLWGEKIRLNRILTLSGVVCALCYLTAALAPNPFVSLAACAFTGAAVSLIWPGVYSLCAASIPRGGASMFALLSLGGDIGCSMGPWLMGMIADQASQLHGWMGEQLQGAQIGMKAGLLTMLVFPAVMLGCMIYFRRRNKAGDE